MSFYDLAVFVLVYIFLGAVTAYYCSFWPVKEYDFSKTARLFYFIFFPLLARGVTIPSPSFFYWPVNLRPPATYLEDNWYFLLIVVFWPLKIVWAAIFYLGWILFKFFKCLSFIFNYK